MASIFYISMKYYLQTHKSAGPEHSSNKVSHELIWFCYSVCLCNIYFKQRCREQLFFKICLSKKKLIYKATCLLYRITINLFWILMDRSNIMKMTYIISSDKSSKPTTIGSTHSCWENLTNKNINLESCKTKCMIYFVEENSSTVPLFTRFSNI